MEDDDFYERLDLFIIRNENYGYFMKRPSSCISTYYSLQINNNRQYNWSFRRNIIFWSRFLRQKFDGINNLEFDVLAIDVRPLYTFLEIEIKPKKVHELNYILCDIPAILLYIIAVGVGQYLLKSKIILQ